MKRLYPTLSMLLLLGLHATPSFSQNEDFMKQFKQARNDMMNDYNKFRNTVLTDYDKYMQGVWKEFELFKADKLPDVPKPKDPPAYKKPTAPEKPVSIKPKQPVSPMSNVPAKQPATPPTQQPVTPTQQPTAPKERPTIDPVNKPKFPEIKPDIPDIEYTGSGIDVPLMPVIAPIPVMPALPNIAKVTIPETKQSIEIDYYGEKIQMQKATKIASMNIASSADVAEYWKLLKKSDLKEVTQAFATQSRNMGLNDWASVLLVEKYINAVMPNASKNERVIATQYVLANCGYNIRLGMNKSMVAMLVPYAEHVYEKSFIFINSKRYYLYPDVESDGVFRSCELPKDAELGKDVELRFAGNTVIGDSCKTFNYQGGGLTLSGEVRTGIMPLLDEYPVIDIPTVASSVVDKTVREQVVEQIRSQVQGLDEQEAANKILHFIQRAFKYATDGEQFGREKYFYFEESLFYPKNDCEDRAIFYAYLIHEILKLDVHLIQFPGHECTAVAFTQPLENGTSYEYKGKTYYICDPTYIGANIGKCMTAYKNETPQIEVWY